MKKFLVLYMAPASVLEEWKKAEPEKRKEAESKMMADWDTWMKDHAKELAGMTAGLGGTKRVTSEGVSDTHNDIMLTSMIEAESQEAAAQLFVGHPHFGIPQASIEVMEMHPLPGMEGMQ